MKSPPNRIPGEIFDLGQGIANVRVEQNGETSLDDRSQSLDHEREKRPYHHTGDYHDPAKPGIGRNEYGEQVKERRD